MSDLEPGDLDKLRELPQHRNAHDPAPKAREAFDKAFGREPVRAAALVHAGAGTGGNLVVRTVVPTLLAGLVALYLLWAFSAAFALQGR